jgi:hypothetical protein
VLAHQLGSAITSAEGVIRGTYATWRRGRSVTHRVDAAKHVADLQRAVAGAMNLSVTMTGLSYPPDTPQG